MAVARGTLQLVERIRFQVELLFAAFFLSA